MTQAILILGAGGHAKVLISCLRQEKNIFIKGILEKNPDLVSNQVLNIPILGNEETILPQHSPQVVKLVNGIGSIEHTTLRETIYQRHKKNGYSFLTVIHPHAYISEEVTIGEGAQLMAGSILQPGTNIGNNTIINSQASIDHDCNIGDHVHIAPGVICSGGVTIGARSHIGTGAVIRQGITIGENCLIAAGAVVVCDLPSGSQVKGVPARLALALAE